MPSYIKTVCSQCGGLNGAKGTICTICQRKCSKCGNPKGKQSKQCKQCYTAIQKSDPALAIQMRTPQAREKATKSLNEFFLKTGHSRAKQCPTCNADFIGHTQAQVYCSSKCAAPVTASKNRKRLEASCLVCGKTFSHARYRTNVKYCSMPCYAKRNVEKNSARPEKHCIKCGSTIHSPTSFKFCSKTCVKLYQVGENAPAWKDGKSLERERLRLGTELRTWRIAVFIRDKHTCQKCGSRKDLHAHHVKEWARYPELRFEVNNGMTLCIDCHGLVHGKDFRKRIKRNTICPMCNGAMTGRGKTCRKCMHKARKLLTNLFD